MDIKKISQYFNGDDEWDIYACDGTKIDFDLAVKREANVLEISAEDKGKLKILTNVEVSRHITMTESAFRDFARVMKNGGTYEITKSTDGKPMILATTAHGYTRQFLCEEELR